MYKELIKTRNIRKDIELELTTAKQKFEDSIALKKAQLDDIKEKEFNLQEEVVLQMEKEQTDLIEIDDATISYQIRRTTYIKDINKINDFVSKNKQDLYKLGLTSNIIFKPTFEITNKKELLDAVGRYIKLNNKYPDGISSRETKFITIKNK